MCFIEDLTERNLLKKGTAHLNGTFTYSSWPVVLLYPQKLLQCELHSSGDLSCRDICLLLNEMGLVTPFRFILYIQEKGDVSIAAISNLGQQKKNVDG